MVKLQGGIADGSILELGRAPLYLRVVIGSGMDGQVDALDQLDDTPEPDEVIFAYRWSGQAGWVHYDYTDKRGRRRGKTLATAEYTIVEPQPTEDVLRSTEKWREWCLAQTKEQARA